MNETFRKNGPIHTTPLPPTQGPHLSVYFNAISPNHSRDSITCAIQEATRLFGHSIRPVQLKTFLAPLFQLKNDMVTLAKLNSTAALFRSQTAFRVLSLPFSVKPLCVLAQSFHIKPLIKWSNFNSDFALMGINSQGISLYRGSLSHFNKVDTLFFHELEDAPTFSGARLSARGGAPLLLDTIRKSADTINAWTEKWIENYHLPIYFAGNSNLLEMLRQILKHPHLVEEPVGQHFGKYFAQDFCYKIREKIKQNYRIRFENELLEFFTASKLNLTQTSVSQVAKAAAEGRIKKLYIAEDYHAWGTLNKSTGEITFHGQQMNHMDDDVLDDLAELVIEKGGQVVVAPTPDLPGARPVSAVLNPHPPTANIQSSKPRISIAAESFSVAAG